MGLAKQIDRTKRKLSIKYHAAKHVAQGVYTLKKIPLSWKEKPKRYQLINEIIAAKNYQSYLEIGCRGDTNFTKIATPHKVGVDPQAGGTHRMTSDEFFAQSKETFDIIFIDGLHLYEQVILDITNSVACLNEGGTILLHDCIPTHCLAQFDYPIIESWNGDVWKAILEARTMPHIDTATCLIDHGVGIIKKRPNANPLALPAHTNFKKLKYAFLAGDYARLMNVMEYKEALAFATRN